MSNSPLLSICIPTFNRSEYLAKCLNSIISQREFDERVEVVISDNCSSDNTEQVVKSFSLSNANIKYYRNSKNLVEENQIIALKRGTGLLRKLSNDTILYKEGSIKYLLELIDKYKSSRPLIFLHNYNNSDSDIFAYSVDEFVRYVSYRITWIGSVCIWNDGLERLNIYSLYNDSHLAQVPYLLNESIIRKNILISNKVLMYSYPVKGKNLTYGLYQVFYENFLNFINEYKNKELISFKTYESVRKDLIIGFFSRWCAIADSKNNDFIFSDEKLTELVERAYSQDNYLVQFKMKYYRFYLVEIIKKLKNIMFNWI